MAYYDLATLAYDGDFTLRVAACYEQETNDPNPTAWAGEHNWQVAGAPGFSDAYASALASGVERPGMDPSVISDDQILSAVQPLIS